LERPLPLTLRQSSAKPSKGLENGKEVETINPDGVEAVRTPSARGNGAKAVSSQPTAEEIARLTFAKLRDIRVHTQELRNRFARLLNRGSSLE
jgi:hypothetical protein